MNKTSRIDTQFAAIVISAAVLLGLFSIETALRPEGNQGVDYLFRGQAPEGKSVNGTPVVYENPPLPSDFSAVQATGTQPGIFATGTPSIPPVVLPLSEPAREVLGLKIFEITATADGFSPAVIVVGSGDRVELDVIAVGSRFDVGIPGLSSYLDVPEGERRAVSFDALYPGEYPFSCRAFCPNGRELFGKVIIQ